MTLGHTHHHTGRVSWAPWIQLRLFSQQQDTPSLPSRSLKEAARRVAPLGTPHSWQADEGKRRLILLCEWLQAKLEDPIRTTNESDHRRRVTVFDSVTFSINYKDPYVVRGRMIDGRNEPLAEVFELGHPLADNGWIRYVIEHIWPDKFPWGAAQGNLFLSWEETEAVIEWLVETTYRLLLQQPTFRRLRKELLPRALALPADIRLIALASRIRPLGPLLDSRTFNLVWRNERSFRVVARENPQLLPILMAYVESLDPEKPPVTGKDPVSILKNAVMDARVSDAGWRYLCRHGSRLFRVPWDTATRQPPFNLATRYLRFLEDAGLPPPPPPALIRTLFHAYSLHQGDVPLITINFHAKIDPYVLRAGLLATGEQRGRRDMADFAEEFLGVCWWAETLENDLDANQRKAPWSWFVRQWRDAERLQTRLADCGKRQWQTRSEGVELGRWEAVPIRSEGALIREGHAMRNCLEQYVDECMGSEMEVYSIRERATGRRRACAAYRFNENDCPDLVDVKGFANTPPKGNFDALLMELYASLF